MSDYTVDTITRDDRPGWRARILHDVDAEQPYDELGAHVISLDGNMYDAPGDLDADRVRQAWDHYRHRSGDPYTLLERYLGITHGATVTTYVTVRDGTWIVSDSTTRREQWGCEPQYVPSNVNGTADEWRAWAEGDVYGVIVERHRAGVTTWDDGTTDDVEDWEHVDSCWGFYGWEYVEQQARRMLDEISAPAPVDA